MVSFLLFLPFAHNDMDYCWLNISLHLDRYSKQRGLNKDEMIKFNNQF